MLCVRMIALVTSLPDADDPNLVGIHGTPPPLRWRVAMLATTEAETIVCVRAYWGNVLIAERKLKMRGA